jgi:hypothetical protein
MSWIFGYVGKGADAKFEKANKFANNSLFQKRNSQSFFIAGGNARTLLFNETNEKSFSILAGIGIIKKNSGFSFVTKSDLKQLNKSDFTSNNINGHFVVLTCNENTLEIFTDKLGLRDLYYAETSEGTYFSTRLDWLNKFTELRIDPSVFGSRWMTFHQLNLNSVLNGCSRLVSGYSLEFNFTRNSLSLHNNNLEYDELQIEFSKEEFEQKLLELSIFPYNSEQKLTLSLSGGTDSRLLLSLLLNQKKVELDTHTFGDSFHPDAILARKLADELGFEHKMIQRELPSFDQVYDELKEYTAISLINNPSSAILQLRNYELIDSKTHTIIDGCIGEIWRREFLYKLQLKGAKGIKKRNNNSLFNNVYHFRADLFNSDFQKEMTTGIDNDISTLFNQLPDANKIGVSDWIDYFAIKTRFPNYFGHEQNYLDQFVVCYMPFIQLSLMQMLFNLPASLRKNGKFFKGIISSFDNRLTEYDLVKGIFYVPFKATSFQGRILTFLMGRFSKKIYSNENQKVMLNLFKEYLLDRINSTSAISSFYYDQKKVKELLTNYYSGKTELGNQVDWLLSFEIFTELLENK